MRPLAMLQHKSRNTRGETLVETLAATLVAVVAVLMLFTAASTATKMNANANAQATDLREQQHAAASQDGEGTDGSIELECNGAKALLPATFFGGKDYSTYRLQLKNAADAVEDASGRVFFNTRPASPEELAAFSAWPEDQGPVCWYRESSQGHEYFAARPARQAGTLCLVYYGGRYYKATLETNGSDTVVEAASFDLSQLGRTGPDGVCWVVAGVS